MQLARLTGEPNQTHTLVRLLQHAFATWPYAIVEYKPTYGAANSDRYPYPCP